MHLFKLKQPENIPFAKHLNFRNSALPRIISGTTVCTFFGIYTGRILSTINLNKSTEILKLTLD